MLQSLPLRSRLSLLLGAVLALGLLLGAALLTLHAGARIRAEAEAATRLAGDFATSELARAETAPDPWAELGRLLAEARRFRHLRIYLEGAEPPPVTPAGHAPAWFSALAMSRVGITRVPMTGRLSGALIVAANPADEISEIWEEIVALSLGGALVALAAFALVFVAVSRTLAPVEALAQGLARLEQGDHAVRVPSGGSPEFVVIADRINALAATLERLDGENHALLQRMIHVQEDERRDIARDLHDEIGPFLFAIRAGVGALRRKGASLALEEDCARIDAQIAALQQVNRRILARLRPAALEEMGLAGALEALVQSWRESHPEVAIELRVDADEADEQAALAAFRVVQEGLTNAFRHSGARHIRVDVSRARPPERPALRIRVGDDGAGLAEAWREGLGLRGMSERLATLGGDATLRNLASKGATLEARIPISLAR